MNKGVRTLIENPLEVVKKLDAAFNSKDINAVLEFYEEGATVVAQPGKIISGKEQLRAFFEEIFQFDGVAQQEKMQVIESGDIALFISKWHLTNKSANEKKVTQEYCATSVFRKNKDGRWRLVIDNSFGPAILEK